MVVAPPAAKHCQVRHSCPLPNSLGKGPSLGPSYGHSESSRRFDDSSNIYVTTQWPAVSTQDLLTSAAPHLWMYARLNLFHARSDTCHGQRAYLSTILVLNNFDMDGCCTIFGEGAY